MHCEWWSASHSCQKKHRLLSSAFSGSSSSHLEPNCVFHLYFLPFTHFLPLLSSTCPHSPLTSAPIMLMATAGTEYTVSGLHERTHTHTRKHKSHMKKGNSLYLSHENLLKGRLNMNLRGFLHIKSGSLMAVLFCVGPQFNNVHSGTCYNIIKLYEKGPHWTRQNLDTETWVFWYVMNVLSSLRWVALWVFVHMICRSCWYINSDHRSSD